MEEALGKAAETYGEPVMSLNTVEEGPMRHINEILVSLLMGIQDKCDSDRRGTIEGISVGLPEVDEILRGLNPGGVYIVGGRPGMGKTSFLINITAAVAADQNLPVAVFSPKTSTEVLAGRLVANVGGVDRSKIGSAELSDQEWQRITYALGKLPEAPIFFSDSPRMTSLQICLETEQLAKDHGPLGLIIVDGFQMLSVDTCNQSLATGLSLAIRDLKVLARELNVPIVVSSYLNRAVDLRPNKRPILSDLRDTGALEDTADAVLFVYRDEVYNPDSPSRGEAEIIVARNTKGPTGIARIGYLAECGAFYSYYNNKTPTSKSGT